MANTLYNNLVSLLTGADVPEQAARSSLDRLLTMHGENEESVSGAVVKEIQFNIVGIVVLRGDKSQVPNVKASLSAMG